MAKPSGFDYSITADSDTGLATAVTDQPGWLHLESPNVNSWVSIGPGTNEVPFYYGAPGSYRFAITNASSEHHRARELYSTVIQMPN